MALANYTDLKAAVATALSRTDKTAEIVDWVTLAEKRLNRNLRLLQMETTASLTLSADATTIALPTGFLELIDLYYDSDFWQPTQHTRVDVDFLGEADSKARPNHFTISDTLVFDRPADQAYAMTMVYYKAWDLASDTTNWLMTNAPDAYLYSTLIASCPTTRNWSNAAQWADYLKASLKDLNTLDARNRRNVTVRIDDGVIGRRRFDINRGY